MALLSTHDAFAQDRLYALTQEGGYALAVGDYVQVCYVTKATATGIGDLKVDITGQSLKKVAVFDASIRGKPPLPGGDYYMIALFRAEEPPPGESRDTRVVVTPISNEGQALRKFTFSASVR